jgi:hypothetical protein
MADAFEISAPRNFKGLVKAFNTDGFAVIISTSWVSEFTSLVVSEIDTIAEVSIDLGIKNSMLLANEIIEDDTISTRTKIAFALVSPITQSAMRMRAIIRRIPESEFRRTLIPMLTKVAQAGMQNVHTPAHYQSAFPSLGLIGRLIIISGEIVKNIKKLDVSGGEEKKIESYSEKDELEPTFMNKPLINFPANVMFPGLGGIYLENNAQTFHKKWSQHYFDDIVVGTNYDEGWYSLTAADKHPWFMIGVIHNDDTGIPESMSFSQKSDEKMTLDHVWEMIEAMTEFMLKREITIEKPELSSAEDFP